MQIEIRDFSVSRGSFTLHPVSFQVNKGEIFAILGRTGSGKTVLLEAISGMFPGEQGGIFLNGVNVCSIPPGKRKIGFVYQDHGLFPHMNVFDNITYGLKMHGYSKAEQEKRALHMMEAFSISHIRKQYPGTLSGGESQRVALARTLVLEPEILLLDEPFSALDPATRRTLHGELLQIHEKYGCTIVFVTHDFSEAMELSHRIGILLEGRLRAVVESKDLLTGNYSEDVELFLGRTGKNESKCCGT